MNHVLCFIPTKDRYFTTLPLAIQSVINQTRKPDKIVIYDDSDNRADLRNYHLYRNLFDRLEEEKIKWEVIYGKQAGQHYGHHLSQDIAEDLIWRLDDDNCAEKDVLEKLLKNINKENNIGAVGGLVLMPKSKKVMVENLDGLIENIQWYKWEGKKEVQHLYSSFLYKKGIADYELSLSRAAHREETIFSHRVYRKGFKLIVDSDIITYHYRNPDGGIRSFDNSFFEKDEKIFKEIEREWKGEMVCHLNNGKGDHVVFKSILPLIKEKYKKVIIGCCYPDIFDGEENILSIDDTKEMITPERLNIYKFMSDRNWKKELVDAFKKMYLDM
jgi:hypothetical protein